MTDGFVKIKLGGKERSLKFNMRAMEALTEVVAGGQRSISASVTLVHAGLIGWCYAAQVEPDFTFQDVCDWVEDLVYSGKDDTLAEVNKSFADSRAFSYLMEKQKEKEKPAEAKKKKKG